MYLPSVQVEKAVHQLSDCIAICQMESTTYTGFLCVGVRG